MLFNSFGFPIFLTVVFVLYWFFANKSLSRQNLLLLVVSYFFYAFWDWRFLFLLAFSTGLDYYTGKKIHESKTPVTKKMWLWISIGTNLGFLAFFKYFNFFVSSFAEAGRHFGLHMDPWMLNIILPIGISFYTFHGLSYALDIYNEKIEPERNFIEYSVFVSFFPLLVAGPIERATHLLPQIKKTREFNYSKAIDGLRQILWGFFKKVVIADNCAEHANAIFNNSSDYSGSTLILGAVLFAFQIYGDFSGYSDIALGTARLLGIELLRNFSYPYFSRDIAEFWRRWHISLSSWFRDYVYIPLGGSKRGKLISVRNIFIVFILSGFWHGANWTFIVWGALNALYFLPLLLLDRNRDNLNIAAQDKLLPTFRELLGMIATFGLTVFAWIFFRAESLPHAFNYVSDIFSKSILKFPEYEKMADVSVTLLLIFGFMIIEWFGRDQQFAIARMGFNWPKPVRLTFYSLILFLTGMFMQTNETPFIYFQF